jgi:hypothetical protein
MPVTAADAASGPSPAITLLFNDTLLNITASHGDQIPAPFREPEPLITLLRLESGGDTFPGPRSMAFGPRYIELSANRKNPLSTRRGSMPPAHRVHILLPEKETAGEWGVFRNKS